MKNMNRFAELGLLLGAAVSAACGGHAPADKPARPVKPGDELVFALGGRLIAIRVEALGARRGPATEARTLYSTLQETSPGDQA